MEKTRVFIVGIFFMGVLGLSQSLVAEEKGESLVPREKAVVLGFDVGLGAGHYALGSDELSILLGFKVGVGLTERLLPMLEISSSTGLNDVATMQQYLFSLQWFAYENFYLRGGGGLGQSKETLIWNSTRTRRGFASALATGYE